MRPGLERLPLCWGLCPAFCADGEQAGQWEEAMKGVERVERGGRAKVRREQGRGARRGEESAGAPNPKLIIIIHVTKITQEI